MKYSIALIITSVFSAFAFSQTKINHSIRCASSIAMDSTTKPLIVVDGKQLPSLVRSKKDTTVLIEPLSEINAKDIERIDVLKDENATSIYGEKGKNGVIEITLKRKSN